MNIFDQAKTKTDTNGVKKGKKGKREVQIDGLETLASINALITSLNALKETAESQVKDQMLDEFVTDGMENNAKPESFRGVDGIASASCEIRKRSSRSVLNDSDVKILEANGIHYAVENDVDETFVINPEYAGNSKLLEKVSKALTKVPGLPNDFIIHQPGKSRRIADDKTVNQVFGLPNEDTVRELAQIVTVLAVKPTLHTDDLSSVLDNIKELIS